MYFLKTVSTGEGAAGAAAVVRPSWQHCFTLEESGQIDKAREQARQRV